MTAVPPLAGILRYGDVRGSDTSSVAQVLRGIVLRVAIGLPGAGVGADEETGAKLADRGRRRQRRARAARGRRRSPAPGARRCARVAERRAAAGHARRPRHPPPARRGRARAVERRCPAPSPRARTPSAARAGSRASSAPAASCSSTTRSCSTVLDGWVARVPPDAFTNVLPLLRRAFSVLPAGERRRLGERLREPKGDSPLYVQRSRRRAGAAGAGDRRDGCWGAKR